MSKREDILKVICQATVATMDDLLTALPGMARKQIADNLQAAATDGLIKRERDDVTGQPCYRLTDLGRKRLESGPSKQIIKRKTTPAGRGANNTGSHESDHLPCKKQDEVVAVVEQPKPAKAPVKACSDVSGDALDLRIRIVELEESHRQAIARGDQFAEEARRQTERADAMGGAIVKFCEWLSEHTAGRVPMNLTECRTLITMLGIQPKIPATLPKVADAPEKPTSAIVLLNRAAALMTERGQQYDKPEGERSMGKTVAAFNTITGCAISEAEGWLLLQLLKDVRQWQRPGYHADSGEDCIAYAALKAESLARVAA